MMFRNILKYTFKPALCNNVKIKFLSLKYIYNIFVLIIVCHALKYTFFFTT